MRVWGLRDVTRKYDSVLKACCKNKSRNGFAEDKILGGRLVGSEVAVGGVGGRNRSLYACGWKRERQDGFLKDKKPSVCVTYEVYL